MPHSSLLTNLWRPRDAKWMWPVMGLTSLVLHGLAVAVVRSLSIEVAQLNATPASPLPIQLVTLPPDTAQAFDTGPESSTPTAERPDLQGSADVGSTGGNSEQVDPEQIDPPPPVPTSPFSAPQTRPSRTPEPASNSTSQPRGTPTDGSVAPPNSVRNPRALPTLTPAPEPFPQPAPESSPAPTIRPQPEPGPLVDAPSPSPGFGSPSPVPPPREPQPGDQLPELSTSPPLVTEPPVSRPPQPSLPPGGQDVAPPAAIGPTPAPSSPRSVQSPLAPPVANPSPGTDGEAPAPAREPGGTLTTYVRDHPDLNRRRDNPDVPPQVQGDNSMAISPLPAQCTREQLSTLQMVGTTTTVALDVLVEADGRLVPRGVLPGRGSGNSAVDDLVICLARERLRLRPAYWEGAPIKTDAFIVEMQISF